MERRHPADGGRPGAGPVRAVQRGHADVRVGQVRAAARALPEHAHRQDRLPGRRDTDQRRRHQRLRQGRGRDVRHQQRGRVLAGRSRQRGQGGRGPAAGAGWAETGAVADERRIPVRDLVDDREPGEGRQGVRGHGRRRHTGGAGREGGAAAERRRLGLRRDQGQRAAPAVPAGRTRRAVAEDARRPAAGGRGERRSDRGEAAARPVGGARTGAHRHATAHAGRLRRRGEERRDRPAGVPGVTAPNLVVLLADQWRGQDQGWLDGARGRASQVRTPHLDRLAAGGAAIAGGCSSSPVCGPSRGSLLTGRLPHQHGVVANDLPLSPRLETLGTALSGAGYRTGWIGKWHLAGLPRDKWVPPAARPGIEHWAGVDCSHDHLDGHYYVGAESPTRIDFVGYEPEVQTDLAVEFLAGQDAPFFLTVCYNPPHDPYDSVPERLRTGYPIERMTVPPNTPGSDERREVQRLYWSAITAVDAQIGRILAELDRLGLRENTIVVVTSDHGDMLGAHGLRAKQSPYAEAVRVPMVISGPGVPACRPAGLLGLVDLAPTLLGLLGLPPIGVYGRDLSDRLRSGASLRTELLIGNWVSFDNGYDQGIGEWRGFVTDELTYARTVDGRPWLLFDDRADPWQLNNLAGDPASASRVAAADDRLSALLAESGDGFWPAGRLLTELGLVDDWNAREIALRGDRARLLPTR
ncbi:hypothetical protein E1294_02805 [Nonomuraea diastatica]|uniref:Sulfatase N-terminal domain-containing protein n=1 Tax=Nonomuraea diastatica TaxID=1848329 RepID=A0A4R4X5D6_9ACTN|nr:hypothetical protein E1294_02805 [Nonomuraea diastatica]